MRRLAHRLLIFWMTATVAHFPLPVWDGDNFRNESLSVRRVSPPRFGTGFIDIDVILLGCDAPDDPDDGPVDDPEDGEYPGGIFPVYLMAKIVKKTPWSNQFLPRGKGLPCRAGGLPVRCHSLSRSSAFERNELSEGDCRRTGMVVLRC